MYKYSKREYTSAVNRGQPHAFGSASMDPADAPAVMAHMADSMESSQPFKSADNVKPVKTRKFDESLAQPGDCVPVGDDDDADDMKRNKTFLQATFDAFDTQRKTLNSAHAKTSRHLHAVEATGKMGRQHGVCMGTRPVALSTNTDERGDRQGRERFCSVDDV